MTSRLTEGKSWEGKGDGDPGRDLGVAQEEVGPALLQPPPPPFPCPAFSSLAMMEDSFSEWVFNSESFKEDYVLLLFLSMDSNVDKAELEAFSAELDQLASLGCQVGNLN